VHGVIYLHRRDLLLSDNPVLGEAAACARESHSWFLILAIWEPKDDTLVPELDRPRLGTHYRRLWAESVAELAARYRELRQRLVVLRADPADAVARVCREWAPRDAVVVYTPRVPGTEEATTLREITRRSGAPVVTPDATTLLSLRDLPFSVDAASVPGTFTSFRTRVERAGLPVGSPSGTAPGEVAASAVPACRVPRHIPGSVGPFVTPIISGPDRPRRRDRRPDTAAGLRLGDRRPRHLQGDAQRPPRDALLLPPQRVPGPR